jgi:hypothetical protein
LGNGTYAPIQPIGSTIRDSYVLLVGVESANAPQRWYTGGWANQLLLFRPSSTTSFIPVVQNHSHRLRLHQLNLCVFPKLLQPWLLDLRFPTWLKQVDVEVWKYDGRDYDLFHLGATDVNSFEVAQSATPIPLLEANPERKGGEIYNAGTARLAIELNGVPSFRESFIILDITGLYEIPYGFTGQVSGVWEGAGDGQAEIREYL